MDVSKQSLDPAKAGQRLQHDYKEYLKTHHRPEDELTRENFYSELEKFTLSKGPFLHASSAFKQGSSLQSLVDEDILDGRFMELPSDVFPPERCLYAHQESAIRKTLDDRNLIIATGTGSGKTECFLIPILQSLFEEIESGTIANSGVRSMLLYPMNALANDQMKRLREVLKQFPEITFGRYIGDTKEKYADALASYVSQNGDEPANNELISRSQMTENPPHILLTNYSMLEYLLLRPRDTALFDGATGKHWRSIILDEVHVYSGAKGAEISMLLSRVKERIEKSGSKALQFIGTSATLGDGKNNAPEVVKFASDLFGEKVEYHETNFDKQDLVLPEIEELVRSQPSWTLPEELIEPLYEEVLDKDDIESIKKILHSSDAPLSSQTEKWAYLWEVFHQEHHVIEIQRQLLSESVIEFPKLADQLFNGNATQKNLKLTLLLELCNRASLTGFSASLIPARYHYFLRALEGAFVCISPEHPTGTSNFSLTRQRTCAACEDVGALSQMHELALCSNCGTSYLVGKISDNDTFIQARVLEHKLDYLLITDGSSLATDEHNEDEISDENDSDVNSDLHYLCAGCGKLSPDSANDCQCTNQNKLEVQHPIINNARGTLSKCLKCSSHSSASLVKRFLGVPERPQSLIATSVYQSLPPANSLKNSDAVGEGRKLLAFADSRQDAAFFAPYLNRTYQKSIYRKAIWELLNNNFEDDVPRFADFIQPLLDFSKRNYLLEEDAGDIKNKTEIKKWLLHEILSIDPKESLEAVGLVEISIAIPQAVLNNPPQMLSELGFSNDEIFDLARILLNTLRRYSVVDIPNDVDIKDQIFSPRNAKGYINFNTPEAPYIKSWIPKRGSNTNLDYLSKVFDARDIAADPKDVLESLWRRWFAAADSPWAEVLRKQNNRGKTVFVLNPERFEFIPRSEDHQPYKCKKCQKLWWRSISDVCQRYRCNGELIRTTEEDLKANFYFRQYKSISAIGMKVKEHTGQLESEHAAEIQQDFIDGKVNVISGSTTWELGVDVGDVNVVLLRNFPPSPANYVQRAGRAGRRIGSPALVITYARRNPHDLQHYTNPDRMIKGKIPPPIIATANERIVRRHLHAVAFAMFERRYKEETGATHKTVGDFFSPDSNGNVVVDNFVEWLRTEPDDLLLALQKVCPENLVESVGLDSWRWVEALTDDSDQENPHFGWLKRAADEVQSDLAGVEEKLKHWNDKIREYQDAGQFDKAKKIQKLTFGLYSTRQTIAGKSLLDFLASRVVLPKYGFPVDVADLNVSMGTDDYESSKVDLNRDLKIAIAEYAPGEKTVANGRLWKSVGVRVMRDKQLLKFEQWECSDCNELVVRNFINVNEDKPPCQNCGSVENLDKKTPFVVPSFGFIGRLETEKPGESRPQRSTTTQSYYSEYQGTLNEEFEKINFGDSYVEYRYSRQGQITVVTTGLGFKFCKFCGYMEKPSMEKPSSTKPLKQDNEHPMPRAALDNNTTCNKVLEYVQLGHQYLTDVAEIKIPNIEERAQALSVMHAMLSSTSSVGIDPSDLGGTLRAGNSIVIFDTVPGGAGHVRRFIDMFEEISREALQLVANCECGEDTSCYGCLRNFGNQMVHAELTRRSAINAISTFLGG